MGQLTTPLAAPSLVEQIAAAFHTLVRGWHFDPSEDSSTTSLRGEVRLDSWIEPTVDPVWRRGGAATVDVAGTWWGDLPADWRARFLELAGDAGGAVVAAAQQGRTPMDLAGDEVFLAQLGDQLQREWLSPPRVIALGGGVEPGRSAGPVLALVAVHVYARQLFGFQSTLGTVPTVLPSQLPDPASMVKVGGAQPRDAKYAAFSLNGDRLSTAYRARLTELAGYQPTASWSLGGLNLNRSTGRQYRPHQTGHWSLSSRDHVLQRGPALEDHILWLLTILEPHRAELLKLISDLDLTARIGCYYSQTDFNAEWVLSERTIRRIAELRASFWFDSYRQDDEEAEDD